MTAPAPPRPILWTVADYDTCAVLMRPDNTAAARFHVIAEAHEACRALNGAAPTTRDWLAAHEPELLAALVEWHGLSFVGGRPVSRLLQRLFDAIERAGLIAPPAPFHLPPRQFQEMHNAG